MRNLFAEYGIAVVYVVAAVFAFALWGIFMDSSTGYKNVMNGMIASISGSSIAQVHEAEAEIQSRGWTFVE